MKNIIKLSTPPAFISYSAVGGYEEMTGPLGDRFDMCDPTGEFGQDTWEKSEGEMSRLSLNLALSKIGLSHGDLGLIIAGDLQNQCVATALSLSSFGTPYLGVYGACSTCTESLLILSAIMQSTDSFTAAAVTSSHNSAAEKQFRTPLEYGGQRAPSAQWTATAAGSFILSTDKKLIKKNGSAAELVEIMPGRIIDGAITDGQNMGGAMAFAACDSILRYFEESDLRPQDFDYIVTGDLGKVGSSILKDILSDKLPSAVSRHIDCGNLLFSSPDKDVHSGASGCGTSAAVLSTYFLPLIEGGELHNILFLSTGAMMSPSSLLQGKSIMGIAPIVRITARTRETRKEEK